MMDGDLIIKNKKQALIFMWSDKSNVKESVKNYFNLRESANKIPLSDVFVDRHGIDINEYNLFVAHFNYIPNFFIYEDINSKNARTWFINNYGDEIKDYYYNKRYVKKQKKVAIDDVYYFLYEDLLIYFNTNSSEVIFLFKKTSENKVNALVKKIKRFKHKKKNNPHISLIYMNHGLDTRSMKVSKINLSIEENYNDDFKEVHETIMKRLLKKNDKGLVLLHGKPGTGKTSYIRYLISKIKKNVIFLPPNLASEITNPEIIPVLMENPNSVFVIEDAEKIIIDREKAGSSAVSALLNISDGLLSDCLNIQIICTFNTDIAKVDNALLRKGRLIAKYEFKNLEAKKAQALSNKLGFKTIMNQPMSLTAIYNQEEKDYQEKKREKIGFKI